MFDLILNLRQEALHGPFEFMTAQKGSILFNNRGSEEHWMELEEMPEEAEIYANNIRRWPQTQRETTHIGWLIPSGIL